ncbi:MAG: SMC family ATPase, partial [Thermoplasmata archaeon]|nr:SMC family ATPase [Thermoplasmata archaeon]
MKPSWLEMENIGPFVKRTRVDLDSIEDGGLFLISGPTGSGKSFIFDSICYALYGKTPSGRDKNLRSDHAPIGEDPIIRFCFQVGDIRYLVERTLEAPRKSGGATNRPEKASLVKLIPDGSGGYGKEVVASKKSDVKVEVTRILGLEMEQFSRVMMIPQGEFRELLRADTDKREVLLRQLFNSLLYKDITDSIDSRSKKL